MYKVCKTEQSAARQRELEEGLLTLMLTRHYDEISVSDLCMQMNIPRKSFYRYFSGKDGALHALIDHTLLEFEGFQISEKTSENQNYPIDLDRFFRFWLLQKPLLDALERSGISGMLVTRTIDHALADIGIQKRYLLQGDQLIHHHATMFGVCGLMSMVLDWHHSGYEMSARQMSQIAAQLLTRPLFENADMK